MRSESVVAVLLVAAGGMVGAVARFGLSNVVQRVWERPFPLGTFSVNVAGCLAIGAVMALVEDRHVLSENVRALLVPGLLGGFTTFSALGFETLALVRDGSYGLALFYSLGSLVVGIAAVALGRAMTLAF